MPQAHRLKLPTASQRMQKEGRLLWNEARSADEADFFTLGYTGRPLPELLDLMVDAGVRSLVDVRQAPVSMYRPEVSKRNLARALEGAGIMYLHLPELGVPRDIRARAIDAGSRDPIWEWYDEHVATPWLRRNLHRFLNFAEHPVALMCVETDPRDCHRHRLFLALEEWGFRGFDL